MRGIYWLVLIVVAAWLLILGESYIFFVVIRPIGPPIHIGFVPSTVAKILGTVGLTILWFVVMLGLRALYVRSRETRFPRPSL